MLGTNWEFNYYDNIPLGTNLDELDSDWDEDFEDWEFPAE